MVNNNEVNMIKELLGIEHSLREAEACLRSGSRHLDAAKCDEWFSTMEALGFLEGGKFLSVLDIINKCSRMYEARRVYSLEAVGCDLSLIAKLTNNGVNKDD